MIEGLNAPMSEVSCDKTTSRAVVEEHTRKAVTVESLPSRQAVADISRYRLSVVPELYKGLGNRPIRISGDLRVRILYQVSYVS